MRDERSTHTRWIIAAAGVAMLAGTTPVTSKGKVVDTRQWCRAAGPVELIEEE